MMFKKEENEDSSTQSRPPQSGFGKAASAAKGGSGNAVIGPSITVKGDVTGDEDLVIQGRVEGAVSLAKHNLTIGPDGHLKADVDARTVIVEGEVEGDIRGQEQIVLRHTARVEGSIAAPRVTLEDGAVFRGGIEMGSGGGDGKPAAPKKAETTSKVDDDTKGRPAHGAGADKETGARLPA
jgi:cytoskeletal protein CcmA (bactofilin family)